MDASRAWHESVITATKSVTGAYVPTGHYLSGEEQLADRLLGLVIGTDAHFIEATDNHYLVSCPGAVR